MMDKLQHCPNPDCDMDWDAGEVIDHLRTLDVFINKSDYDLQKIAATYGWTPENHMHYSNVITHKIEENLLFECPKCGKVYEEFSGEEIADTIAEAKYLIS